MDQEQEEFANWQAAKTKKRRMWQPHERAENIFKGASHWDRTKLGEIDVVRLSVLPAGASLIPDSYGVVANPEWKEISEPELPFGFDWQQSLAGRFDFYFELQKGLKCLALGERFSGLNVRGEKHTLISTDNPHHDESMDSMYKPIPFLVVGSHNKFSGIFIDSAAPSRFDLDTELTEEGRIELFTRRGFRVYIFGEGTLPHLVDAFTTLVGRAKLPPLWSLGHQQCRWSYPDEETVRELAHEFRQRKIPCDTLVLDIDYMDEYRVFTTNKQAFPDLKKLVTDLKADNFKVVTIVDPGVKVDETYTHFVDGRKKELFCKTKEGEVFQGKVWPGDSAFPDFLKDQTRKWWADLHKFYTDAGVAGIWNDMNEPAFFGINKVLPNDFSEMPEVHDQFCVHEAPEGKVDHLEVRNLYGFLMTRSTQEGLLAARPGERPFVLTRSGSTGIQRYAAVWLGDNKSWYEHLGKSIPMLLNVGLSGMPFAGVDIGGFWDDALPELVIRWYEVGIFYPFFRNHCSLSGRGQEAYAYAPNVEGIARKLIETRYRLLPYIRGLFWEHMRTGAPLMRPLMWHYPTDEVAGDIDDEFMFGGDILVAPIVERSHEYRTVYLPSGNWFHFETNEKYEGGRAHVIKMPLGTVPAFVREGAVLPMVDVMQHTGEYSAATITFKVFGKKASGRFFEDDGISFEYEDGKYNEYELTYEGGKFVSKAIRREFAAGNKYAYQVAGEDKTQAVTLS